MRLAAKTAEFLWKNILPIFAVFSVYPVYSLTYSWYFPWELRNIIGPDLVGRSFWELTQGLVACSAVSSASEYQARSSRNALEKVASEEDWPKLWRPWQAWLWSIDKYMRFPGVTFVITFLISYSIFFGGFWSLLLMIWIYTSVDQAADVAELHSDQVTIDRTSLPRLLVSRFVTGYNYIWTAAGNGDVRKLPPRYLAGTALSLVSVFATIQIMNDTKGQPFDGVEISRFSDPIIVGYTSGNILVIDQSQAGFFNLVLGNTPFYLMMNSGDVICFRDSANPVCAKEP